MTDLTNNRTDLEALAARVEAAEGRDMKLGHEILVAVGRRHPDAVEGFGYPDSHADPTASIDAALQLCPPEDIRHIEWGEGHVEAAVFKSQSADLCIGKAATPALALAAAALRARSAS